LVGRLKSFGCGNHFATLTEIEIPFEMVSLATSANPNGSASRESPANLSALYIKSKMIQLNALLAVSDSISSTPVSGLSIRKAGRIRFQKRTNLQRMLLPIALLAVGIAISSNPASGFSLRKVGRFHLRNRMIFEPGHEYSLPPRCWEISPERNEQEAINALHACVKRNICNPFTAIPALAKKECCPDSHWLSIYDSRGQQAKEKINADSISLSKSFGIRGQQTDDSQWLSTDIRGRTVESNSFAAISVLASEEIPTADSISLSKSFGIRGQQTDDSQWLSTDIRGRTVESNSFAAISALASEEIPTADSMRLSIEDDIRGQYFTTDLQRTSKEIRGKIHSQWKSNQIHREKIESTCAVSMKTPRLLGIHGQQYFNLDSPWLSANDIRGSQDTVTEAQSNTLIQTNIVLVARMKSQNERELSANFKSTLFYSPVQIASLIHIGATSFSRGSLCRVAESSRILLCRSSTISFRERDP